MLCDLRAGGGGEGGAGKRGQKKKEITLVRDASRSGTVYV